jgi:hypothetical protein
MAKKQFTFVVDQSETHLIKPASPAEDLAREAVKFGKVDGRVNLPRVVSFISWP